MNQELPTNSGVSKTTKRIFWGVVIIIICIPIFLALNFCVAFFYFGPSKILHEADAGFRKAKETINPEQLRTWALEEIPKYPITNDVTDVIPHSEIPSYIQNLYTESPQNAVVQKSGDQKYVQIFWGGALFSWTLEIGSTNFVPPKDSEVTTVEWVSGVYYNRDDTRHPFK